MHCIMRYVFSLRVFKQMDAHTHTRIPSLFLTLTRGKTMFSPKSYGLVHDVCVKKICACCTVFADALIEKYNLLPLYQLFFPK